jgi:hypothetical protein
MEGERKTVAAAVRAKASGRLLRLRERRELRGILRKVVFASRRSSTSSSAKKGIEKEGGKLNKNYETMQRLNSCT